MPESLLVKLYQNVGDGSNDRDCPGPEELAAFCDGKLQGSRKNAVEKHLAHCDDCLELVVLCKAELPEDERGSVLSGVADIVISFADNAVRILKAGPGIELLPGSTGAAVMLRGAHSFKDEKIIFSHPVGDFSARIEISKIKNSGGDIKIILMRQGKLVKEKLRVTLLRNDIEFSSCPLEDGEVHFSCFSPGLHVFRFFRKTESFGELTVMIEENL